MENRDEERERERVVEALERIYRRFGFNSQAEMARETGISQPTMSRALDRSKQVQLSEESRWRVTRYLGRQSESEEELRELVAEVACDRLG